MNTANALNKEAPVMLEGSLVGRRRPRCWRQGFLAASCTCKPSTGNADKVCKVPSRPLSVPMGVLISGIYKIKDVGDVFAGKEADFLPTHTPRPASAPGRGLHSGNAQSARRSGWTSVTCLPARRRSFPHIASNSCAGKVFTVEMHHQRVDQKGAGEQVHAPRSAQFVETD